MEKRKKRENLGSLFECGDGRNRTADTRIFSPLLYQLSYITNSISDGKNSNLILIANHFSVYFFGVYLCVRMTNKKTSIIVDAGNTNVKLAFFKGEELDHVIRYESSEFVLFREEIQGHLVPNIFVCSVLSDDDNEKWFAGLKPIYFSHESKLPINMVYKTPKTLGLDRLANAVAAHYLSKENNSGTTGNRLIIDLGTCIKFDLLNDKDEYLGGSIDSGLEMRFKSLPHFTGKLPLIKKEKTAELIGSDTENLHPNWRSSRNARRNKSPDCPL